MASQREVTEVNDTPHTDKGLELVLPVYAGSESLHLYVIDRKVNCFSSPRLDSRPSQYLYAPNTAEYKK